MCFPPWEKSHLQDKCEELTKIDETRVKTYISVYGNFFPNSDCMYFHHGLDYQNLPA